MHRSSAREITCRELVDLVTDYLDGALAPAERERFEAHLAECEGCDHYVEQIRTTVALTQHTRDLDEHPDLAALLSAFREYQRPP